MNTKEFYIYLAGFVDGEGCISSSYKEGLKITAKLSIANTNFKLMKLLQRKIGGSIYQSKQRTHYQLCYTLSLYGQNTIKILKKLYPYLIIKQKQAKVLIDFYQNKKHVPNLKLISKKEYQKRKLVIDTIKKLNKRIYQD